ILAYRRSKYYFYGYYLIKLLTAMFCEGSVVCLSLAYVADNIAETQRASAFGMLAGVGSAAFVCGTLTARFISTSSTFQVSTFVTVFAIVYMRTFLVDSSCQIDESSPLLAKTKEIEGGESCQKIGVGKKIPSVKDMVQLLSSSLIFTQAAVVAFFSSLAEGGLHASMMYFLKAQFHFSKNQFADLMLIAGLAGSISQLLLMPMLAPALDEVKLLRIGLFAACAHMFLYSISWASWVPYFASSFCVVSVFAHPCIRSIASKQLSPEEQGKGQGCISGMCAFANIVSPLTFTPLTALFLSDRAPFHFPGFSIMCTGFAMMIAFTQSTMIKAVVPVSSKKISSNTFVEP
ncbi:Major facilitator superfamily protein, partial [Thalictrum thalictroides]